MKLQLLRCPACGAELEAELTEFVCTCPACCSKVYINFENGSDSTLERIATAKKMASVGEYEHALSIIKEYAEEHPDNVGLQLLAGEYSFRSNCKSMGSLLYDMKVLQDARTYANEKLEKEGNNRYFSLARKFAPEETEEFVKGLMSEYSAMVSKNMEESDELIAKFSIDKLHGYASLGTIFICESEKVYQASDKGRVKKVTPPTKGEGDLEIYGDLGTLYKVIYMSATELVLFERTYSWTSGCCRSFTYSPEIITQLYYDAIRKYEAEKETEKKRAEEERLQREKWDRERKEKEREGRRSRIECEKCGIGLCGVRAFFKTEYWCPKCNKMAEYDVKEYIQKSPYKPYLPIYTPSEFKSMRKKYDY